jgi:hypothetical protein
MIFVLFGDGGFRVGEALGGRPSLLHGLFFFSHNETRVPHPSRTLRRVGAWLLLP